MAKVIATNRTTLENKHIPFPVQFGNLNDPQSLVTYEFKTDGIQVPSCIVKDPAHLARLVASGYTIEPEKGEKEEDLQAVKDEGARIKAAAEKKAREEQARLNRAAENKLKLARAKTKPQVTVVGTATSDE